MFLDVTAPADHVADKLHRLLNTKAFRVQTAAPPCGDTAQQVLSATFQGMEHLKEQTPLLSTAAVQQFVTTHHLSFDGSADAIERVHRLAIVL
jgi:hypothetical protein